MFSVLKSFVSTNAKISRCLSLKFPTTFGNGGKRYEDFNNKLQSEVSCRTDIMELGGADRPALPLSFDYNLYGMDVDNYGNRVYDKYNTFYEQSAEAPADVECDLIYSVTLMEHVQDTTTAFESIFKMLTRRGKTMHYFPSKNCFYALALRCISHRLQQKIIKFITPEALGRTGYEAFFNNCSAGEMRKVLNQIGYTDIKIKSYYRANRYFESFLPAFLFVSIFENMCAFFNLEFFATGLLVEATK